MNTYEVINPSDTVTFRAPSDLIAALAVIILGEGRYGAHDASGKIVLPILLLSGEKETALALREVGITDLGASLTEHVVELVAALNSAQVVTVSEREAYDAACPQLGGRDEFRKKWKEERRTSSNDICENAWRMAAGLARKVVA